MLAMLDTHYKSIASTEDIQIILTQKKDWKIFIVRDVD